MSHVVLIVDDEPAILELLHRTLRREPYRVVITSSAEEAVRILAQGGIDVLVSDVDMPAMSGLELIAHARRTHPHVVRVLLTGAASADAAIRAINDGEVHRFLTKHPWNRDEIVATLRGAIERIEELRRGAAASASAGARERLLLALEREHPGISEVPPEHDVYELDRARMAELAARVTMPSARGLLAALLDPLSPPGDDR